MQIYAEKKLTDAWDVFCMIRKELEIARRLYSHGDFCQGSAKEAFLFYY